MLLRTKARLWKDHAVTALYKAEHGGKYHLGTKKNPTHPYLRRVKCVKSLFAMHTLAGLLYALF